MYHGLERHAWGKKKTNKKTRKGSKGNDFVFEPQIPVQILTGSVKPVFLTSLQFTEGFMDKRQRSDILLVQLGIYVLWSQL